MIKEINNDCITLEIERGLIKTTIKTDIPDLDEVTDIGIKIRGDDITVGTTNYSSKPHFEKIDGNEFLSWISDEMIDDLIFFD